MLLSHVGYQKEADKLAKELDICTGKEAKYKLTGRSDGATNAEFSDYLMETIESL